MRVRLAFEKASRDPRVFVDDAEVTSRCYEVAITPGRKVRLGLFKHDSQGRKYLEPEGRDGQRYAAKETVEGTLMEVTAEV